MALHATLAFAFTTFLHSISPQRRPGATPWNGVVKRKVHGMSCAFV